MKIKNFIPILFTISLTSLASCNFVENQRQDEVDRAVRTFASVGRDFVGFFEDDLDSCQNFLKIYDEISEIPQPCDDNIGTLQATKISVQCQGDSPIQAVALFDLQTDHCQDNHNKVIFNGPFQLRLEFTSAGNFAFLNMVDLFIDDLRYETNDYEVQVEFSNNNLRCEGEFHIFGDDFTENCEMERNCRDCNI